MVKIRSVRGFDLNLPPALPDLVRLLTPGRVLDNRHEGPRVTVHLPEG
jgi:hypothetical protein